MHDASSSRTASPDVPVWLCGVACSECVARSKRAAKGWQGLQVLEVLEGWKAYLGYGLPCVLMVCLEVSTARDVCLCRPNMSRHLQLTRWLPCVRGNLRCSAAPP